MTTRRRRFTAAFKKRVALEALRGEPPVQAIAAKHQVHPNQVSAWKRQAVEGLDEAQGPAPTLPESDRTRERGSHSSHGPRTAIDERGDGIRVPYVPDSPVTFSPGGETMAFSRRTDDGVHR